MAHGRGERGKSEKRDRDDAMGDDWHGDYFQQLFFDFRMAQGDFGGLGI